MLCNTCFKTNEPESADEVSVFSGVEPYDDSIVARQELSVDKSVMVKKWFNDIGYFTLNDYYFGDNVQNDENVIDEATLLDDAEALSMEPQLFAEFQVVTLTNLTKDKVLYIGDALQAKKIPNVGVEPLVTYTNVEVTDNCADITELTTEEIECSEAYINEIAAVQELNGAVEEMDDEEQGVLQNFDFIGAEVEVACDAVPVDDRVVCVSDEVRLDYRGGRPKPYKCDFCEKYFCSLKNVEKHTTRHTINTICKICKKDFYSFERLKRHRVIHSTLRCMICDKAFRTHGHLRRHIIAHAQENNYRCDICGRAFSFSSSLKRHMVIHKRPKKNFCVYCEKTITYDNDYIMHMLDHLEETDLLRSKKHLKYSIPLASQLRCKKQYINVIIKNEFSSEKYKVKMSVQEVPYRCQICDTQLSTLDNLNVHLQTHAGEKPFECQVCDLAFSNADELHNHLQMRTGELPYKCEICSRGYTFDHLNDEILGEWRRECEKCYYKAAFKDMEKCKFCARMFSLKRYLTTLEKIRAGVRPYLCEKCGYVLVGKTALNKISFY